MRILLVEDDDMLGDVLAKTLAQHAHAVDWVVDGAAASAHWASASYDMVLLDLGLPGGDGLQVLAAARAEGRDTPAIILTARDQLASRVAGLDAGADDYLLKPFELDELLARIRDVARRMIGRVRTVIEHMGLVLELAKRIVRLSGEEVTIPRRGFVLLGSV